MSERPAATQRFAIGVEYDGSAFNGWQVQPHAPSVQGALNSALSVVANTGTECVGAGRTDTGVHATGQVAHFDTQSERSTRSWMLGINSNLPDEACVFWVRPVHEEFHARFSALARSYRYVILNRSVRSALERKRSWWVRQLLDADRMHAAAQALLGKHDFSAFRASSCQAHTPVRELTELTIRREGEHIIINCRANAFLHHMVRNLVGSLVQVGKEERGVDWIGEILQSRDRTLAGITAPAAGLSLIGVDYPDDAFAEPEITGLSR